MPKNNTTPFLCVVTACAIMIVAIHPAITPKFTKFNKNLVRLNFYRITTNPFIKNLK